MSQTKIDEGKVAVVMGASRGIGLATANALARGGVTVVLAARNGAACENAADSLRKGGHAASAVAVDVTDYSSVQGAVRFVEERFGRLDILINNAGVIEPLGRIGDCDPADWALSIQVNLIGAFNACRAGLRLLTDKAGGVIVNVSSGAAENPVEAMSAYCSGKAGLTMLTRCLALEHEESGLRVFGFRPGRIDTGMHGKLRSAGVNSLSLIDRSTLAAVDEPAEAITFLCSTDAASLAGMELDLGGPEFGRFRRRQRIGCDP